MLVRFDAYLFTRLLFVLHIEVRTWVISHQYDSQPRHHSPTSFQSLDLFFDLFLHFFGYGFTVYDECHIHSVSRLKTYTEKEKFVKK